MDFLITRKPWDSFVQSDYYYAIYQFITLTPLPLPNSKLYFKILSTFLSCFKLRFSAYCMNFLITRKSWEGFCSNFQRKIITTSSVDYQCFIEYEAFYAFIFKHFWTLIFFCYFVFCRNWFPCTPCSTHLCIYTQAYTHTRMSIRIHVHSREDTYATHIRMHAGTHIHSREGTHELRIHMHSRTHMHSSTLARLYIRMYTYLHTHMCSHAHIHTIARTQSHTHTIAWPLTRAYAHTRA